MITLVYILLAALGLSFLIFIHELGHYLVARRVGIRVEVFSIGMGQPIFSWNYNGVKWQIGILPLGGYVKMAGEKEDGSDPYKVKDGFFGQTPWNRIKVLLAGPLVNIAFALIAFCLIFVTGGREQKFSDHTRIIGLMDRSSELYEKGIRPGDTIKSIDDRPFNSFRDLIFSSVVNSGEQQIRGSEIDYFTGEKKPYDFKLTPYPHPFAASDDFKTIGVLGPAMYLIYDKLPNEKDAMSSGAPMEESGIQKGDRVVWLNGELVFSIHQLRRLVNEPKSLLTIERDGETKLVKVPRVQIADLRLSKGELSEFDDWQHEIGKKGNVKELTFIPYELSSHLVVQGSFVYIDDKAKEQRKADALQKGDHILAIDGVEVISAFQLLDKIQEKRVQMIVKRGDTPTPASWKYADNQFEESINPLDLRKITTSLGNEQPIMQSGNLHLLGTVTPLSFESLPRSSARKRYLEELWAQKRENIEAIKDPKQKSIAEAHLEAEKKQLYLGIAFQDRQVVYNPNPFTLFWDVCKETGRTLKGLVTGMLHPKWMSGPVGIVHVMQHSWGLGPKEALYWLGLISLNLGFLNLLPIPVLDGGNICFALWEWITRKPIPLKVMERMVIPFVIALILFFLFVTFQDITRLFGAAGL